MSLRSVERYVVPVPEKLDGCLALSRPIVPALAAGQRHHEGAALGRDAPRNAIVIAGRTGAIELSHRREA